MKKQNKEPQNPINFFDLLSEETTFMILDNLNNNPFDTKSFSLVCKSFYQIESTNRKALKPLPSVDFTKILTRYPFVSVLDLSLCPRITDTSLKNIAVMCGNKLTSIDLSRSKMFSIVGLSSLVMSCPNLCVIDLSNAENLRDQGMAVLAGASNLERLCLDRCKSITDMGIGCVAVGCGKLRALSLKWCLGIGDLGVGLIAVKCKEIRSLDISYLPVI